jgi:hypothetical protein
MLDLNIFRQVLTAKRSVRYRKNSVRRDKSLVPIADPREGRRIKRRISAADRLALCSLIMLARQFLTFSAASEKKPMRPHFRSLPQPTREDKPHCCRPTSLQTEPSA